MEQNQQNQQKQSNQCWERLVIVMKEAGLSANAFAHAIGLKRSENLYQIKRGNHGISKDLANRINKMFPHYSTAWLLFGSPENRPKNIETSEIPVYDNLASLSVAPYDHIAISKTLANGAEFALIYRDDALTPRVPSGSYVLLKKVDTDIIFGHMYLVNANDFNVFRVIRRHGEKQLGLSALNENYDDIVINRSDIKSLYKVCSIVSPIMY